MLLSTNGLSYVQLVDIESVIYAVCFVFPNYSQSLEWKIIEWEDKIYLRLLAFIMTLSLKKLKVLNFLYLKLWAWKCSLCQQKSCRILDFLFPYLTTSSRALQVHELDGHIKSCCRMGELKMGMWWFRGQHSVKGIPNTSARGKR